MLCMLAACEYAEIIFYEHEPSETFYHQFDIGAVDLESFIDDDILFVARLKDVANPSSYIVWQGLYTSKKNKTVKIEKAIIQSGDWKEESILDQVVALDEVFDRSDLLKSSVKLFQIKGKLLEEVYQSNGYLHLKVFYEIGGKVKFNEYELKRRVEKWTIFPT